MPRDMLEHPDITWCERTGYPSYLQPHDDEDGDEDDFRDDDADLEDYYDD